MKIQTVILTGALLLSLMPMFGQTEDDTDARRRVLRDAAAGRNSPPPADTSALTRFDLDFPGGKPKELVAAVQKALGKPLNAIVPDEYADEWLPALKMTNVNVAELFSALIRASSKVVPYVTATYGSGSRPNYSYQAMNTSYGFKTEGKPRDDSIWYFFEDKPALPPNAASPQGKVARFYLLTPYLERGLTVDDITTAIQTGWKMLGDKETPAISFHKETKLLIAVGDASKLETIDAVLKALEPPAPPGGRRFGGGGFGGFSAGGFSGSTGHVGANTTNPPPAEEPKNDQ